MLNNIEVQNLHERLACYFSGNDAPIDESLCDVILEAILENVEIDVSRLSVALEWLDQLKAQNKSTDFRQVDNMFDVSTQTSKTYVKGFMSKGLPILYFYKSGDKLPFFKIKSVLGNSTKAVKIETASSAKVLAEYKNKPIEDDIFYLKTIDVVSGAGGIETTQKTRMKAGNQDPIIVSKSSYSDEYKLFFDFIQNALKNNGIDVPDTMSAVKFECVFLELYERLKKCVGEVEDFTMTDLVMMMNSVINDKYFDEKIVVGDGTLRHNNMSLVARAIASSGYSEKNRRATYYATGENSQEQDVFSVVKASNYASIDIKRKDAPYVSYMMGMTNQGFTLFKSYRGQNKEKGDFAMLTFNLTDNLFRLSASYEKVVNSKPAEDVIMRVSNNGEIELSTVSYTETANEMSVVAKQAVNE